MARHRQHQINHARAMRRDSTWGEIRMWQQLRGGQLGARFRRQEPIGPYIADFACRSRKVVIEIDGSSHDWEDQRYAERRDAWFRTRGWIVVHLSERYVLENTNGAIDLIQRLLADPSIAEELE